MDLRPKGNPEHFLLLLVIIIIIHSLMMFAFFRLNFENEVIAVEVMTQNGRPNASEAAWRVTWSPQDPGLDMLRRYAW